MRDGHLLKRAGREFVNNLAWMLVVFGSLGAILVFATQLPLLGVAAYVGISASALAAIVTVFTVLALWSGAYEDTSPGGGHSYPVATTTLARIPTVSVIGPLAIGGMVA